MSGDRSINTGGGNYIHSLKGNYIQGNYIQGNSTEVNQDFSQVVIHIQQRLAQLQDERKYSSEESQRIVATELANQAKSQPALKQKLITLGKYVRDGVANGLIGQAAVEVVKIALQLLNTSLF
ncbi:hypothetical protein NDA01_09580 [Trichocoleus desertorum AS-A10]|uniref:hypothetical protein n=1 Tax=Trichocoleus desertorum TaxID=1481672 RepID=UPI00329A1DD8